MRAEPLVSIGLPVYNGADTVEGVLRSVLAQTYDNLEVIISDNASNDETQEICRALAREDDRILYCRQPENVGVISNFMWTKNHANGVYFRWIGDDDSLAPDYAQRCVEEFAGDPRAILVTTGLAYTGRDGVTESACYEPAALGSDDPMARFAEMLRLLNASHLLLDPMYGMLRRDAVAGVFHPHALRGDEVYAAGLALTGPWRHIPRILGHRHWDHVPRADLVRVLGASAISARFPTIVQCRLLLDAVHRADLTAAQRREGHRLVRQFYLRKHRITASRRTRKLLSMVPTLRPSSVTGPSR